MPQKNKSKKKLKIWSPKFFTLLFVSVFIFQIACLIFLLFASNLPEAQAQGSGLQIELPGYTFNSEDTSTANLAEYIKVIYKYLIGAVGILSAMVLMLGGIIWVTAGGSAERVANAKAWITASLTGLTLALTSFLILGTINPALVNFQISEITPVSRKEAPSPPIREDTSIGCCITNVRECHNTTSSACSSEGGTFSANKTCDSSLGICVEKEE